MKEISERNKELIFKFVDNCALRGLSKLRAVFYLNRFWDIANPTALADFQKKFSEALGDAGTVEATWVTEFGWETWPPFRYVPKK